MIKIGILGSGSGTNFVAIAEAINSGKLPGVEIAVVISDVENAKILPKAEKLGIKSLYLPADDFKTKLEGPQEQAYIKTLKDAGVELVVLAGFMRMVKTGLLDAFPKKIINIHPALLPAFPGLHSWEQALKYGVKIAGCTVHYVDSGMDTGTIIAQAAVPVLEDDTLESLHARIQIEEHRIYPEAIKKIVNNKLT